jgi:hypothetical protein
MVNLPVSVATIPEATPALPATLTTLLAPTTLLALTTTTLTSGVVHEHPHHDVQFAFGDVAGGNEQSNVNMAWVARFDDV